MGKIQLRKYTSLNFPIPSGMIFEKLLKLDEKLTGQSVTILSIFTEEKTPSMIIYYCDKGISDYYKFKDYSSGKSGDACDLFLMMYGEKYKITTREESFKKILELFQNNTSLEEIRKNISKEKTIPEVKEVTNYTIIKWTKRHADYFREHNINLNFIKTYFIKPLSDYEITVTKGDSKTKLTFSPTLCFGYFNSANELCKIYNPGQKKAKFVKVKTLIQGWEQLKKNKKYCLIMASMKDMGSFDSLNLKNFNFVAPESENVEIPKDKIEYLKSTHKHVFTLFDNDKSGRERMLQYKKNFDIDFIAFEIEKDLAQCMFDHGPKNTLLFFKEAFMKTLKKSKIPIKPVNPTTETEDDIPF
jgi:hypothetical protein